MNFDVLSLLLISAKSIAIYLFILLALRLFGKKELAQLSVVDLVFILLISNSVQNAMVGSDNTLLGGMAAATGLFVINYIFKLLLKKFPSLSHIVQGDELMLIYKGKILRSHLDKSMITQEELHAAVREHGVESIKDVDLAILEVDGNISVLSRDFQHKSMRKRKAHKAIQKNS
ncbi:MAG: DUF421 domain-containing protein [Chitinophagales bacterium]